MVSKGVEEGSVASLELSDGVMEQVEVMAKELRKISRGIKALVEGIGRLTEVEKVNKEMETEDVQRVDKQTETGKKAEDSKEDEESEEEEEKKEKGDDGKEDEGESEGMEDGEKREEK
jgi:hypothetical protein